MSIASDRLAAAQWAQELLQREFVILDSETTDLYDAEFVQLAVINSQGETLLDTLLKPKNPARLLESGASAVNGITPDMLTNAPVFSEIYDLLNLSLQDKHLIIYNADYDWPILRRTCRQYDLTLPKPSQIACAMEMYAQFVGDWSDYHGSYRWQKLPYGDHSALGDCRGTLRLIREMVAHA